MSRDETVARLCEMVDAYRRLKTEVSGPCEDSTVEALRKKAATAVDDGEYAVAEILLNRAAAQDETAAMALADAERRRKSSAASSKVANAVLMEMQLNYARAVQYYREAVQLLEGIDDTAKNRTLIYLGSVLTRSGTYGHAELVLRQVLSELDQIPAASPHVLMPTLNALVLLFEVQARHSDAELFAARSKQVLQCSADVDPIDRARCVHNLAMLSESRGQYEEAELLYEQALSHRKNLLAAYRQPDGTVPKQFDAYELAVAETFNYLGKVRHLAGKIEQAEASYLDALTIRRRVLPCNHPDIAQSLNNMGLLCYQLNRHQEAETHYLAALAIWDDTRFDDHPDIAILISNLGMLCEARHGYVEAEQLYRFAISIWEKAFGLESLYAANGHNNLADLFRIQNRLEEAESEARRALEIRERSLAIPHPDIAQSLNNLGLIHAARGDHLGAVDAYYRAIKMWSLTVTRDHSDLQVCLSNCALSEQELGRDRRNLA